LRVVKGQNENSNYDFIDLAMHRYMTRNFGEKHQKIIGNLFLFRIAFFSSQPIGRLINDSIKVTFFWVLREF
jgi:hypothetical protein